MAIPFMCIIPSLRSKLESSYDVEVISSDIRAELKEKLTGLSCLAMELVDDPNDSSLLDTYPHLIEDLYKADDILYDAHNDPNFRPKDQEVFSTLNSILGSILSGKEINKGILSHLSTELSKFLPEKLESADIGIVACFAYCALIPEGHRIIREILINQWMAEGFLSPTAESCEELEYVGNRYFNELLRRGTFKDPIFAFGTSSDKSQAAIYSCVMDPIAHRVASRIAARDVLVHAASREFTDMDYSPFKSRTSRHRSEKRNSRYRSLVLDDRDERYFPGEIYTFLEEDDYPRTFLLFYKNYLLHFNNQERCFSDEDINFFLRSKNERRQTCLLRVLDMPRTQNPYGLRRDIWHTIEVSIRYLRLSHNYSVQKKINFDNGFKYLQTLALDGCISLDELVLGSQFTRLRHLYLTSKQETLNLSGLTTLRILELSHCGQLRILTDDIKDLTALTTLRIFDCPKLVSLPNTMDCLTNIQELVFHRCPRLFLTNGRCMNTLPNLRHLELIGLHKLVELPVGFQSATALQYFMIADCQKFKKLQPKVVQKLESLERFYIYKCPNLLSLTEDMMLGPFDSPKVCSNLFSLQSLHIRGCPELVTKCELTIRPYIPEIILERDDFQDQDHKPVGPYGSEERTTWSIKLGKYDRIKQVKINAGNIVHGIGFAVEYGSDLNTTTRYFGGPGGSTETLRLAPKEYITHISGSYISGSYISGSQSEVYIRSLVIYTNSRPDGYGPYGKGKKDKPDFTTLMLQKGDVITKFYGRHDRYLASIGMHVIIQKEDHQKSSSSQSDSCVPLISPYFTLKMNSVEGIRSSKENLYQDSEPIKLYSKWNILARVLHLIIVMKAKGKEVHRIREDRQEKLRMQEELLQEPKILCSLFPSDYEFDKDTLVQLWMAAGFINNYVRIEEEFLKDEGSVQLMTEDAGDLYFRTLETQQYLLKSRQDILTGNLMYKINPAKVEEVFRGKQTNDLYSQLITEQSSDSATFNKSCHVSVLVDRINETTFTTLKKIDGLRTLLFLRNYGSSLKQIPSGVFLALKSLQALDLSGSEITQLPSSIQYLTLLRYLDLSYTPIERLPDSIGCLHELQTLKLKGCKHLCELPKCMGKLTNLRHLYFDVLGQLSYMPRSLGALTELRTLSAFLVDDRDGCSINELKGLNNLSGFFCLSGLENVPSDSVDDGLLRDKKGLTQLHLRWDRLRDKNYGDHTQVIQKLQPHSCLQELEMYCYPGSQLPIWMGKKYELEKLVRIVLFECENNELDISLGALPNLEYLEIVQMNNVSKIDNNVLRGDDNVAFPKLETLIIDGMSSLEGWERTKSCDFPALSTLVIKQCPKLATLPFLPYLHCLKHAEISHCEIFESVPHTTKETLIINRCPLLKKSCSKGSTDWDSIQNVPNIWINHEDPHTLNEDDSENDSEVTGSNSDYSDDSDLGEDQVDRKDNGQTSDAELQRDTSVE